MSSIVLDANIAVEWVMTEPATAVADAALEAHVEHGSVAPTLFWAETRNVVLKIARKFSLGDDVRSAAIQSIDDLAVALDGEVRRGPVLRIATQYDLSVYDALYLDLASRRSLPLATNDRALRRAAEAEGVVLV